MVIDILSWGIKVSTEKHNMYLSADYYGFDVIYLLPSLIFNRHYGTGNYTLSLSFLCFGAMVDIYRKDKFQS